VRPAVAVLTWWTERASGSRAFGVVLVAVLSVVVFGAASGSRAFGVVLVAVLSVVVFGAASGSRAFGVSVKTVVSILANHHPAHDHHNALTRRELIPPR
jgi:hypothetical protein